MKTNRKRRAKARGQRSRCARQSRMAAVLRALGLWDDLHRPAVPRPLREWFLDLHGPQPVVTVADPRRGDAGSQGLADRLQRLLKQVTFPCPPLGDRFSVCDYFALVKPLADGLAGAATSARYADHQRYNALAFVTAGRTALRDVGAIDTGARAVGYACQSLGFALLPHDRIDSRVHALTIHGGRTERGRWQLRLVLDIHAPERAEVTIDGIPRSVTRVPYSCPHGLFWVEWPAELASLPTGHPPLPVFIQAHALRAVAERLNVCDGGEWLMHQHLCHSLAAPVVTRRDGPDLWAEFRLQDTRVGYLVCRVVGPRVVVRTFLFLTMDGTPEGDALRRRLRLTRTDKEYLGLDRFRTYLHTDLSADAEVSRLLGGCGCDRLFAFADGVGEPGHAEVVRKYVGLPIG